MAANDIVKLKNDITKFKEAFDEAFNNIARHHNVGHRIRFLVDNEEKLELDDSEYPFGLEYDRLLGCGCECGIIVNLKRVKE
jgi:hypothetical protein